MSRHFTILPVLVLIAECAASVQAPPEGAQVFEAPPAPRPGTQFVYRSERGVFTDTVSEDMSPFKGREVYRLVHNPASANWAVTAWDAETHNLVAIFNASGTLLRYYTPHESEFDWPLWVGKTSRVNFTQVVRKATGGRRTGVFPKSGKVKVEALETITTPAGTFEAMRIKVSVSGWRPIRIWWARDVSRPVRHRARVLTTIRAPQE